VHLVLLLPLVAVLVWVALRARNLRDDPAAVLHALRATHGPSLPAAATVQATQRTEPTAYNRETIFDFIDGAAEAYIKRGFEQCVAANYTFPGPGGTTFEIAAELHRFANEHGASEQMAAEQPSQATPLDGAPHVLLDASLLVATHGRDYLKLTVLGDNVASRETLSRLARAWLQEVGS